MMLSGRCLCGAVALTAATPSDGAVAHECHCTQCRRQSGHVWAFVTLPRDAVRFLRDEGLATYGHTPDATRGFCRHCGSFIFWRENASDTVDLSAGLFDAPTGLRLAEPSFPEDKGDYYDLGDPAAL